jgi:hypothetical protein
LGVGFFVAVAVALGFDDGFDVGLAVGLTVALTVALTVGFGVGDLLAAKAEVVERESPAISRRAMTRRITRDPI